jgi:hypothetical protein
MMLYEDIYFLEKWKKLDFYALTDDISNIYLYKDAFDYLIYFL